MSLKLAYNTTDSAVLVDEQGYTIGGRGWGVVDSTDPIAQTEFDARRLVDADEDALAASDNPDARAAVDALRVRRERLEAARALSKDELADQLDPEQLARMETGGDGLPAKSDLVEAVAASGEDEKKSKTQTPRRGQK